MTVDLVAFLRARLDDDEQAAGDVPVARLSAPENPEDTGWPVETESGGLAAMAGSRPLAAHIARWDPARALADVEAKRRIINLHDLEVRESPVRFDPLSGERIGPEYEVTCGVCGWASMDHTSGCATLRLLALPYAEHPDYREEWRP